MLVVAEVGTNWMPSKFPLEDAIKAAMDCGADVCKIQFWSDARVMAMRRGGAKGLEQWQLQPKYVVELAQKLFEEYKRPVLGASVFIPGDVKRLEMAAFNSEKIPLALIKTATQEYQYTVLAYAVSDFSTVQGVPLFVSVPRDGCLVVGNYWSSQPITWLYCEPLYPAADIAYDNWRVREMSLRLPGVVGISDHTAGNRLVETWGNGCNFSVRRIWNDEKTEQPELVKIGVIEKHFLYDERLRGQVPDGGPWSLSQADFKKYVEIAHGKH